jgi:hypothetical protein
MDDFFDTITKIEVVVSLLVGIATGVAGAVALYKKRFRDDGAKIAGMIRQIDDLEKTNYDLDRDNSNKQKELLRVSAIEAVSFANEQLSHGNDGSVFDRLSLYLTENSNAFAEVCANVAETRLVRAMATGQNGNFREAYRLAALAHGLDPDCKDHRDLHDELALRLAGQPLTDDVPESQHDIFEWLHLRDADEARAFVSALTAESLREFEQGRYTLAVLAGRAAHRLAEQRLSAEDEIRLSCEFQFAVSLASTGDWAKALPIARETWEKQKTVLPPDHPNTLTSGWLVASILRNLGRNSEAEPIARETWEKQKTVLPPDHPNTLTSGWLVASILHDLGRNSEAEPIARETWEKGKTVLPPDHPDTLTSGWLVASILRNLGRNSEAEPIARETWEKGKTVLPPDHPYTLGSATLVAAILSDLGRDSEAEPIARETWEKQKTVLPPDHPNTLTSGLLVASILQNLGRNSDADTSAP